jgi:hypothetical protein
MKREDHRRGRREDVRELVAGAGQDDVGMRGLVAVHVPDARPVGAVLLRFRHGQPLQLRLLVDDDQVQIVPALEAMVGNRQQTVRIGRQIDAGDAGLAVDDRIDETRALMAEADVANRLHPS